MLYVHGGFRLMYMGHVMWYFYDELWERWDHFSNSNFWIRQKGVKGWTQLCTKITLIHLVTIGTWNTYFLSKIYITSIPYMNNYFLPNALDVIICRWPRLLHFERISFVSMNTENDIYITMQNLGCLKQGWHMLLRFIMQNVYCAREHVSSVRRDRMQISAKYK